MDIRSNKIILKKSWQYFRFAARQEGTQEESSKYRLLEFTRRKNMPFINR